MLARDLGRLSDCYERMDVMPLGSCALAGTTYPIDRSMTAELLGFSAVSQNSLDGVSDRDFCVELGAALSLIMTHLSRFSEEIILWCSSEFHFIELDDAFATGSSIMPQKKNPDIAELIRSKTGRVNGNLSALLTMLKGLPLAYNKDLQEDKEAIFDSVETVKLCLRTFTPMLETMTVKKERMRAAGRTRLHQCHRLRRLSHPERDSLPGGVSDHRLAGEDVHRTRLHPRNAPAAELSDALPRLRGDLYRAIDISTCVEQRTATGRPGPVGRRRSDRRPERQALGARRRRAVPVTGGILWPIKFSSMDRKEPPA